MSAQTLPTSGFIAPRNAVQVSLYFVAIYIAYKVISIVYNVYLGPLSKIPGPKIRAISALPKIYSVFYGEEAVTTPALHKKYGPVVRLSPSEVSFVTGQAWKDIYGFKKHGEANFQKDKRFYNTPVNGVDSLVTADDSNHSRQRKIVSHAFSDKALKEQEPMLKEWAEKLRNALMRRAEAGETVDILAYYNFTTFDIMGTLTFHEDLGMLQGSEYVPWVKTMFGGFKQLTKIRAFRYYSITDILVKTVLPNSLRQKAMQHFKYSTERVDRRLAHTPDSPDLWSRILEKSEKGDGLSIGEHHSNGALFMVAGTETTATILSGTTFHLLKNPQVYNKLVKEIRETFSTPEEMTLDSLTRLTYLNAVLQEGLRMYPPVPVGLSRKVPEGGAMIDGRFVSGDISVSVHQYSAYTYEENFKHAYKFAPERWLGDPEYENDHRGALEPFSIGPRNCLGKNLAWLEMRLLLATVLRDFDFSLREESKDWSNQKVYTLWEKRPLMVNITPIKASDEDVSSMIK